MRLAAGPLPRRCCSAVFVFGCACRKHLCVCVCVHVLLHVYELMFVYLSVSLSSCLSFCPCVRPSVCLFRRCVCPSVRLYVRPSVRLSVRPSVPPSVHLSVRLSCPICLSVCLPACACPAGRPAGMPAGRPAGCLPACCLLPAGCCLLLAACVLTYLLAYLPSCLCDLPLCRCLFRTSAFISPVVLPQLRQSDPAGRAAQPPVRRLSRGPPRAQRAARPAEQRPGGHGRGGAAKPPERARALRHRPRAIGEVAAQIASLDPSARIGAALVAPRRLGWGRCSAACSAASPRPRASR